MRKNQLYPVIHAVNLAQVRRNIVIAQVAGADGVFLINHSIKPIALTTIYEEARKGFEDFWIGLNFLGVDPEFAITLLPYHANALWMDDVGFIESADGMLPVKRTASALNDFRPQAVLFGGLDFKYRMPVHDLARATALMAEFVDVVTTSGEATGSPPPPEKLELMRAAAPHAKLAIASGMTPGNVGDYLDTTDCFLVATGISKSFTELDLTKVRAMALKMHR